MVTDIPPMYNGITTAILNLSGKVHFTILKLYKYVRGPIIVDSIHFISFTITLSNQAAVSSLSLLIIFETSDSEIFVFKISSNESSLILSLSSLLLILVLFSNDFFPIAVKNRLK